VLWGIQEEVQEFWRLHHAHVAEYEGYLEQTKEQYRKWAAAHVKLAATLAVVYAIVNVLIVPAVIIAVYNYAFLR
jgi:uncharacterized membrane protein YdjX (TVP38/TMEM64 family)